MSFFRFAFFLLAAACFFSASAEAKPSMVVCVAVVDLRSEPHTIAEAGVHDPRQETQLLYGERVKVTKAEEGWAYVEALEQSEYTHKKRWQGYPGWLPLSALLPAASLPEPNIVVTAKWAKVWKDVYHTQPLDWQLAMGTTLHAEDIAGKMWKLELVDGTFAWMAFEDAAALNELAGLSAMEKRRRLIRTAEQFIGDGYVWGGRSPHTADARVALSGVDCSGLVNLSYRALGIAIPRDAHEQYLRAQAVKTPQPGDLIFLSEYHNPKHIVHVMLYAGSGEILEAPDTGKMVRRIALAERLGQSLDWLASGAVVEGQTVFFGSYLP